MFVSRAYIRSAKTLIADKFIALTGMMSALIFVLQMINFPIAAGTSGHLLGGALAVIVLGPRLGLIHHQCQFLGECLQVKV